MIIYITKNLLNNKKYIGKDSHNDPNYLGSGSLLLGDIKKYGKCNFKKEILEHCNKENLGEREEYWIDYFGAAKSKNFYNIRSKTSGWYNKDLNQEKYDYVTNKMSQALIGKPKPKCFGANISNNQERKYKLSKANKGKPKPLGFGEKVSKSKTGIKLSPEHCLKISQGKKGKPQSQQFITQKFKPIIQLDKENNIIQNFGSIEEASKSNPKFKRSNISCCLIGVSKTSYGFVWKYL